MAEPEKKFTHVHDFIGYGLDRRGDNADMERYARWVLNHFSLSAVCKNDFDEFMKDHLLFCDYEGKRYRVTGCSRLGDIWLASDFKREVGYDLRVAVDDCSNWGKEA